jgi:hypothetical protein
MSTGDVLSSVPGVNTLMFEKNYLDGGASKKRLCDVANKVGNRPEQDDHR